MSGPEDITLNAIDEQEAVDVAEAAEWDEMAAQDSIEAADGSALREAAMYALGFMNDPEGLAAVREEWRDRLRAALAALPPSAPPALDVERAERDNWPGAVSDGLTLPCADCGDVPRFDYIVAHEFWRQWVPDKPDRLGVVCLPCLNRRCDGVGLATALEEVQFTGTGHTVVLTPSRRYEYARLQEQDR